MLYGVDVHDGYQAGLSFPTLVQQGYSFAAVKFTEGTTYARDQADEWFDRARAAGLIPGAYHWLNGGDGAAQARWFWRKLQEVGGPQGALIQCDNEDNATWQITQDWAAEWEQLSGGHPFLMYTGTWWWGPRGWPGVTLTPWLWHSHYLTADTDTIPDDPAAFAARIPADWWTPGYGGWPAATLIQFSSRGDAGALANNVDLNCTKLTREQLLALTTTGGDMSSFFDDPLPHAKALAYRMEAAAKMLTKYSGGPEIGQPVPLVAALNRIEAGLLAIAARVDIDPAELAAMKAAAHDGAMAAILEVAPQLADAIVAKLPPTAITADDVRAASMSAFREVLLDAATA